MKRNKKNSGKQRLPRLSGLVASSDEIDASFRARVKSIRCPNCKVEFSDFAIDWGKAWSEGRYDFTIELGYEEHERDGPFKLKCELCGHRSWLNYFAFTVHSAELPDAGPGAAEDRRGL